MSLARATLARLRTAASWPRGEASRTLHALGVLVLVELGLRALSLRTVARLAGLRIAEVDDDAAPAPELDPHRLADVRAVDRAIRYWPLRARCLQRSLVLGHLWRAETPVLRIGVASAETSVEAHAWIEIRGAAIAGDDGGFVALRRPARLPR